MDSPSQQILEIEGLKAGYGKKPVVNGVSISVGHGEVVALIGHNGAGKSTLLKAIFGVIPTWEGRVLFNGYPVEALTPANWIKNGAAYVPQGNRVFGGLTVSENFEMGGITLQKKRQLTEGIDRVLTHFPLLKDKLKQRAGTLSGGEKQMLALSNALILSPSLLLLDEPSLGLAPPLVSEALNRLQAISRSDGVAVLIVEQKVRDVLKISHRVYVLRVGQVSFTGMAESLTEESKLREVYL